MVMELCYPILFREILSSAVGHETAVQAKSAVRGGEERPSDEQFRMHCSCFEAYLLKEAEECFGKSVQLGRRVTHRCLCPTALPAS